VVYRAADWKLDQPDYTMRMRVVAKGPAVTIKLEDRNNGELFAQCPVEAYPGVAVEAVMDSSRYFVLRLVGDGGDKFLATFPVKLIFFGMCLYLKTYIWVSLFNLVHTGYLQFWLFFTI